MNLPGKEPLFEPLADEPLRSVAGFGVKAYHLEGYERMKRAISFKDDGSGEGSIWWWKRALRMGLVRPAGKAKL